MTDLEALHIARQLHQQGRATTDIVALFERQANVQPPGPRIMAVQLEGFAQEGTVIRPPAGTPGLRVLYSRPAPGGSWFGIVEIVDEQR